MRKVCFLTIGASAHIIRFMPYMSKYYDIRALFYISWSTCGKLPWYASDWNEHCCLVPCFRSGGMMATLSHLALLSSFKPSVLILGGFSSIGNYLAYLWGRRHDCKIVVLTERSRKRDGTLRESTIWRRFSRFLYRKIDQVWVTSEDAIAQFRDTFKFGNKVTYCPYPADFERYLQHPLRGKKNAYTLIYPNRMTAIYNPLLAIHIFAEVQRRFPTTILKMNAAGELRPEVEVLISKLDLRNTVEFLDNIPTWAALSDIYASCDIMYLPAIFSNGNYTIHEAMASGMGIVISDKILGPYGEDLRANGSGFVVPPVAHDFVEKICWFIENPQKIDEFAERNRHCLRSQSLASRAELYRERIEGLFQQA